MRSFRGHLEVAFLFLWTGSKGTSFLTSRQLEALEPQPLFDILFLNTHT